MSIEHHDLDIHPIPEDKKPLFINEPWLIDPTLREMYPRTKLPESQEDNIRVFIPLDINKAAILRRIDDIIRRYGEANEKNESDFQSEIEGILYHLEIYDQIWFVRHMPSDRKHSREAIDLVHAIIAKLEEVPDGCAEMFPFNVIDDLRAGYLD